MIIAVISFLKTNKFHLIIYKRYRQSEQYHIIIRKFAQSIRIKNASDIQQNCYKHEKSICIYQHGGYDHVVITSSKTSYFGRPLKAGHSGTSSLVGSSDGVWTL